ncbi:hypothetical protein TVAG_332450 [Trichomonas vaginalis G3]|uniref:Uncharacterized protein n=1 Tax=Trichomonas vaginalis (strain ATCC PRA-98 / G3) TaxID=412133 RepID=A2FAB8_TRIV3|nr:histone-lysine N-methyltransferase family [Trichomonas vaginalis G3]EAX98135.1 hypothetical protein TVAG_332450 [Trichomonas vaginalis G3]KAI5484851.1 histone-lysine N-methyltransferase family [Trichomonas vaginalis G3]|eukprot:XP_001311065.1 hypothetical protein [Trichomonas vaginalis G3]
MKGYVLPELEDIANFETILDNLTDDDIYVVTDFFKKYEKSNDGILIQYISLINTYCNIRYHKIDTYTKALIELQRDPKLHSLIPKYISGKPIALLIIGGYYTFSDFKHCSDRTKIYIDALSNNDPETMKYILRYGYPKGTLHDAIIHDKLSDLKNFPLTKFIKTSPLAISIQENLDIEAFCLIYGAENCYFRFQNSNIKRAHPHCIMALIYMNNLDRLKSYSEEKNLSMINAIYFATSYRRQEIFDWLVTSQTGLPEDFNGFVDYSNPWRISHFLELDGISHFMNPRQFSLAVKRNCYEIVKYFLSHGYFDLNNDEFSAFLTQEDIDSIMLCAISQRNVEMIKLLQQYGYNFSDLLDQAVETGDIDLVKYLIPDPQNYKSYSQQRKTLLFNAVKSDDFEVMKYFIDNGHDINQYCFDGFELFSVLSYAIKLGNLKTVEFLIDSGANVNYEYNGSVYPLIAAMCYDKFEIFKLLIERKADIENCYNLHTDLREYGNIFSLFTDLPSLQFIDPFLIALSMGDVRYLEILLENNIKIETKSGYDYFITTILMNTEQTISKILLEKIDCDKYDLIDMDYHKRNLLNNDQSEIYEPGDPRFKINGVDVGSKISTYLGRELSYNEMKYYFDLVKFVLITNCDQTERIVSNDLFTEEDLLPLLEFYDLDIIQRPITQTMIKLNNALLDNSSSFDRSLISNPVYQNYLIKMMNK